MLQFYQGVSIFFRFASTVLVTTGQWSAFRLLPAWPIALQVSASKEGSASYFPSSVRRRPNRMPRLSRAIFRVYSQAGKSAAKWARQKNRGYIRCVTPCSCGGPNGFRTRVSGVRGQYPRPLDDGTRPTNESTESWFLAGGPGFEPR